MEFDFFKKGFEKNSQPVRNMLNRAVSLIKDPMKTKKALKPVDDVTKLKPKGYSSWVETKKPSPKSVPLSSDTLDYRQLRSEMKIKNRERSPWKK